MKTTLLKPIRELAMPEELEHNFLAIAAAGALGAVAIALVNHRVSASRSGISHGIVALESR